MKFLESLKAQADLDAYHNAVPQPIGELEKAMMKKATGSKLGYLEEQALIKQAIAGGQTTFKKDELESSMPLGELFDEGKVMSAKNAGYLQPAILGPNSIEQQVAYGVKAALIDMGFDTTTPKMDMGTTHHAMKAMHDLGFYVTSATMHASAGSIPEIVVTWQQPDADKLLGLLEYLTKTKHA